MKSLFSCLFFVTALGWSADAQAETTSFSRRWYGWQTLTSDAVGLSLVVIGSQVKSEKASSNLIGVGAVTLFLGTPTLHAIHGNWGKGGISIGLRAGGATLAGALVGGLVGLSINGSGNSSSRQDSFYAGAFAGVLVASAVVIGVDAGVFAYKRMDDSLAVAQGNLGWVPVPGGSMLTWNESF